MWMKVISESNVIRHKGRSLYFVLKFNLVIQAKIGMWMGSVYQDGC